LAEGASGESPQFAFTGERFTPETRGEIYYEHWHRYCVAARFAAGKRVLDAACGEGYGSALLGRVAAEVIGVDISAEVVAHATARYAREGRVRFEQGSVARLGLPDGSIDLVVSFETIEHLLEQEEMLSEFRRVLAPTGLLIISSPNKPAYSDERDYSNEFHAHELDRVELAALLERFFPRQAWLGQRLMFHSLVWPEGVPSASCRFESLTVEPDGEVHAGDPAEPMYFIACCGGPQSTLPALDRVSLLADGDMSIYREFERATRSERKIYAMYLEQESQLERARVEHAAAVEKLRNEQATAIARLSDQLAQSERQIEGLRAEAKAARAEGERLRGEATAIAAESAAQRARAGDLERGLRTQQQENDEIRRRLAYRESLAGWLRLPLARLRQAATGDGPDG